MNNRDYVIFNGVLTLKSEVRISPFQSGLYYGDGCFETFRSYCGSFLHIDRHLNRLQQAMTYLRMPERDLNQALIGELLRRKDLADEDAMVRIQVWREGKRAYKLSEEDNVHMAVECDAYQVKRDALKLITSHVRTMPSKSGSLSFKLSSSQAYMLAAHDAQFSAADAALMLNQKGYISEVDVGNIFWIKDGRVFTPSESCDFIPGITRNILLEMHDIEEGEFEPEALKRADAAFVTNSMMEIRKISSLDHIDFKTDIPLLEELISSFSTYRNKNLK